MSERYRRRTFIATGTAAGAAIVWGAAHPFAGSDIGQTAQAADGASGATGTATPTPTPTPTPTQTATPTPTSTGGSGATGGAKRDKLHVTSGHTLRANGHGVVSVAVSVSGPTALSGRVRLQAVSNGKLVGIGTAHFHVGKGGGKRHVKVHLNKAGRHLLAKRGHVPGRVLASAHGVTSALRHVTIKG
jgi:hypothetical protein